MNLPAEIRNIAHHIRRETGWCVGFDELMYGDNAGAPIGVTVTVQAPGGIIAFRGDTNPIMEHETTLEQVREDLCAWLAGYREEDHDEL